MLYTLFYMDHPAAMMTGCASVLRVGSVIHIYHSFQEQRAESSSAEQCTAPSSRAASRANT